MKIAVLQTTVTTEKERNLREAEESIKAAADRGADLAVLPEMFCCPYSNEYFKAFAEPAGAKIWTSIAEAAAKYHIAVVAGSMPESEKGRLYNTSFVFDRTGKQIARHRKMHLFDVNFQGGQHFKESDTFAAGDEITAFDLEGHRFGLCVCFDLRFPELTRLMAKRGAEAVIVPAAFNMTTGPMHWETLFRQRAVDDQLYTIGCAPARDERADYVSYANSIICSPLGEVIKRAGTGAEMLLAEIDPEEVRKAREQLPLLSARRTDVYEVEENMKLIEPTMEYDRQIQAFRREFLETEGSMDGCGSLRRFDRTQDWIDQVESLKKPETTPANWVPSTQFIYVRESDSKMVGVIQIRHCFNEFLEKYAGHIGYSVCPSERRKGYATQMLKGVLPVCKALGLEKVLISCVQDNEGSRRTILKNGGVYESTVFEPKEQVYLERYWIDLSG